METNAGVREVDDPRVDGLPGKYEAERQLHRNPRFLATLDAGHPLAISGKFYRRRGEESNASTLTGWLATSAVSGRAASEPVTRARTTEGGSLDRLSGP
jgi:hypothetical protein